MTDLRPLTIFVPHASEFFTDNKSHGDGLIAHSMVTRLAQRGHTFYVAAPKADLIHPLPPNVHLQVFDDAGGMNLRSRFGYMWRVRRWYSELQKTISFDLSHQFNPVFTGVSLALSGYDLPTVLGTYASRWPNDPDSLAAAGGWRAFTSNITRNALSFLQQAQADALILCTRAAHDRIPLYELVERNISYIPYPIDQNIFTPSEDANTPARLAREQESPTILFLANPNRRKGIFTLIEAMPAILSKHPLARLQIVGQGGEVAAVTRMAHNLNVSHAVDLIGWQPRDKALEFYRDCTVFTSPSLGEPFGMAPLEAMSCARPVVVTNAGGLGLYVPERGGRKVPPNDSLALAAAINELLGNPELRAEMGRFNREYVDNRMDFEPVLDDTERVYERVLNRA